MKRRSRIIVQRTEGKIHYMDEAILESVRWGNGTIIVDYTVLNGKRGYRKRVNLDNYKGEFAIYDPKAPKGGALRR